MAHSHSHSHNHTHSLNTEKNRSHWNKNASRYNVDFQKTIQQIVNEIQDRTDWIGVDWVEDSSNNEESISAPEEPKKIVRLLDYACGTGLVSRALAPYVTQCVGVDISEGMVAEYNKTVHNQGIPASEMQAHIGNLLDASDSSPASLSREEFYNFDIAVVGLGFHHFDDPAFATKQLASRLKPGGVLVIIDFVPHTHLPQHDQSAVHTVTHLGFSEEDVKKMFEDAGTGGSFDYVIVGKGVVLTGSKESGPAMARTVFMARGKKL